MQNQSLGKQLDAFVGCPECDPAEASRPIELRLVAPTVPHKLRACVERKMARRGVTLDSGIFKPFGIYWS
jgi:hypothetical protein